MSSNTDRISVLERELTKVKARQKRIDDSLLLLIKTWQPLLLTIGEMVVDLAKNSKVARSSALKRLRKGMTEVREILPSISQGKSTRKHQA